MFRLIAVLLLATGLAFAQATVPPPERPQARALAALFGPEFKPVEGVLTADLDGDGAEDAVLLATAENPMLDQVQYQYKVIDPYYAYFGFSDPKMTANLASEKHPPLLLIVHNWRRPQRKFVVINLPVQRVSLGRVSVKKKVLPAIIAEEETGARSLIYWDGKKWRWKESAAAE